VALDRLNVADIGDIDAPPVSIEKCYDVVSERIGAIADAGARPIVIEAITDLAADLARSRNARVRWRWCSSMPTSTRGRVFRRQVLHGTPFAAPSKRVDRRQAVHPGRHPRADVRRRRFRLSSPARRTMIDIDQVSAWNRVDGRTDPARRHQPAYMTFDMTR
jgi:hypothetical protein